MKSVTRVLLCSVVLATCGCNDKSEPVETESSRPPPLVADHILRAFGGTLLGTDRGEWIGKLVFEDEDGNLTTILDENVHGIVENPEGIFVFTGLSHLRTNDGFIYVITREANERVYATMLGRLPGAPSQVNPIDDESASFLVFAGFRNDSSYYECYALTGRQVSQSNKCSPPRRDGF